jgi:hypothetical protein
LDHVADRSVIRGVRRATQSPALPVDRPLFASTSLCTRRRKRYFRRAEIVQADLLGHNVDFRPAKSDQSNAANAARRRSQMPEQQKSAQKRRAKNARKTRSATGGTRTTAVLTALRGPQGATLQELMKATNWQSHSVRGFLSGTIRKKMGLEISRLDREDGQKAYRVPAETASRSRAKAV